MTANPPEIHKAQAAPEFAQDAASICVHCHREIKRVPGGQGTTWVHADTGAVVGKGNPALEALRHHVSGAVERGEAEAITEQTDEATERRRDATGNQNPRDDQAGAA